MGLREHSQMLQIKGVSKVIFVNVVLTCVLVGAIEVCLRTYKTIGCLKESGVTKVCLMHYSLVFPSYLRTASQKQPSFLEHHPVLGFVTRSHMRKSFAAPQSWYGEGYQVTTRERGIRNSEENNSDKLVIVTGDSFAFGDQVNDEHTWTSCLILSQGRYNFLNAGVPGFGAAQITTRASLLQEIYKPELLLISVLVDDDFRRDRYKYWNGQPMLSFRFKGSKSDPEVVLPDKPEQAVRGSILILI